VLVTAETGGSQEKLLLQATAILAYAIFRDHSPAARETFVELCIYLWFGSLKNQGKESEQ
jgi:hypothetical protein